MVHENWKKLVICCGASLITLTGAANAQRGGITFQDSHWFKWDREGRLSEGLFLSGIKPIIHEFVVFDLKGKPGGSIPLYISVSGSNLKWRTPLILQGIPNELQLSKGYRQGNIWHLDVSELKDLQLIVPEKFKGKFKIALSLKKDIVSLPEKRTVNVTIPPSNIAKSKAPGTVTKAFSVQDITATAGKPVPVKLHIPGPLQNNSMVLVFRNLPENITFNKGVKRRGLWIFRKKDLKDLKLTPPESIKGKFPVEVFLYKNLRLKPLQTTISLTIK
ncbi:MAG: hypothetical protein ACRBBN_06310 [Methyloligellaceae bacterium]